MYASVTGQKEENLGELSSGDKMLFLLHNTLITRKTNPAPPPIDYERFFLDEEDNVAFKYLECLYEEM